MNTINIEFALKLVAVTMLAGFLPLTAIGYYCFRRKQRMIEVERILTKLQIDSHFENIFKADIGAWHFAKAVGFATVITLLGMMGLFLGIEIGFAEHPGLLLGGVRLTEIDNFNPIPQELLIYQQKALLFVGMAFLGAYLWGMQSIFRRYSMNDLTPNAYYNLAIRMVLASTIAMLFYHGSEVLAGGVISGITGDDTKNAKSVITKAESIFPVIAFLIGMFPQRGLKWLTTRIPFLRKETNPSVRELPIEMIEGIVLYDKIRLEEIGIDSCYDLANADFIPLLLKTPYCARELADWLMQAKLCVHFGETIKELRENGIRTVFDLEALDEQNIEDLAKATRLTVFNLKMARKSIQEDKEHIRLREAALLLGKFWGCEDKEMQGSSTLRQGNQ